MIASQPVRFGDDLMYCGARTHACRVETFSTLAFELSPKKTKQGSRRVSLDTTRARAVTEPVTIIDVTDVTYMDSAALGTLMGVHVSREKLHQKYAIVGVNERIETLLQVAGVEKILVRYPTVQDALKALGIQE